MPLTRQDAWSKDEDLLLAEVVLRNIREGGTQLKAFEDVGKQLSRTAAACGFRWNSFVRKQYKSAIELAKKQRKEAKKQPRKEEQKEPAVLEEKTVATQEVVENHALPSLQEVKEFLDDLYEKAGVGKNRQSDQRVKELERKIYYLSAENEKLETQLKSMEEDYHAMIDIMERARKRVGQKEEGARTKAKFKIDSNGYLAKQEK